MIPACASPPGGELPSNRPWSWLPLRLTGSLLAGFIGTRALLDQLGRPLDLQAQLWDLPVTQLVAGICLSVVLLLLLGPTAGRLVELAEARAARLGPRSRRLGLALALLAYATALAALALGVLDGFPMSGDEYSYLFQAQLFARGEVAVPLAQWQPADGLLTHHILHTEGGRLSKYPPGTALLLAPFVMLGQAELALPCYATLTLLVLVLLVRRHTPAGPDGRRPLWWVAPLLFATSPMTLLLGASYHSNLLAALAALLLAGAALELDRFLVPSGADPGAPPAGRCGRALAWAGATGAAAGLLLLIRPFDAVLAGLAVAVVGLPRWLREPGRAWRPLLVAAAVAAIPACLLLLWNWRLHGSWAGSPDYLERRLFIRSWADLVQTHFPSDRPWLRLPRGELFALWQWSIPLLVPLAATDPRGWWRHGPLLRWAVFLCLFVLFGYFLVTVHGHDGYGSRYHFVAYAGFCLLLGQGLGRLAEHHPRLVRGGVVCAVAAVLLVTLPLCAWRVRAFVEHRQRPFRIAEQQAQPPAVVFLQSVPRFDATWYTRNAAPLQEQPIIYLRWPGQPRLALRLLMRHFPERRAYRYAHRQDPDRLIPLAPD